MLLGSEQKEHKPIQMYQTLIQILFELLNLVFIAAVLNMYFYPHFIHGKTSEA